jgi:hypothetical protein
MGTLIQFQKPKRGWRCYVLFSVLTLLPWVFYCGCSGQPASPASIAVRFFNFAEVGRRATYLSQNEDELRQSTCKIPGVIALAEATLV